MELDQLLFKRIYKYYTKVINRTEEIRKGEVLLEPLKPRLILLSRALTGRANDVVTSEREGGWSGLKFYLPARICFSENEEKNIQFYLFRVLYLSVQQELMLGWEDNLEHRESEAQQKARETSKIVLERLFMEYPSLVSIYKEQRKIIEEYYSKLTKEVDYSWLYGRWLWKNPQAFKIDTSAPKGITKKNDEVTTEIDAKPSDEVSIVAIDKKQAEDSVLHNQFEKVDTLSEFNGTFKEMDGEDTLNSDEEALRELNLKHTVRSDDTAHSVYKAEFVNSTSDVLVHEKGTKEKFVFYNEWDYKKRTYKADFCKVFPKYLSLQSSGFAHRVLKENQSTKRELNRLFAKVHNEYEKVNKVISGEEIDFDAVVETYADIHAKRTPSEHIYLSKRKRRKDLSVLILMDTSLSADSYTDNIHILDVEKKVVLLFGEVLDEYNISFQIDTFSSQTRNHCFYNHVKTFDEKWNKTRDRIASIEASGFTRIGAALRHAGSSLSREKTQKKWVILLSDGKPNDYDTYEGKYGIEDVKQALRELKKKHIKTFSLAIESQARYYLPQMFGHKNYNILSSPKDLPLAFGKFYRRILNE